VGWLRRLLPLVVAAVAVAAVLRRYSPSEIAAQMRQGHALAVIPWAVVLALGYMLIAAGCDTLVLTRFGAPRYRDVFRGKAAAAVLTSVGYLFGNGGYGVWLARATGVGAAGATGLVVYFATSDLAAVGWVATVALRVVPHAVPRGLVVAAALIALAPTLAIIAGGALPDRGRAATLLRPWRVVPRAIGLLQLGGRTLAISVAVAATFFGAHAFGLHIPTAAAATYGPAVLLVSSLPVNVAGLGAVQGVWLLFFAAYEPGARILAFQILWQWMCAAAFVLRGLPFLQRAVRQIEARRIGDVSA
jgi:hypothetical protein